MKQTPLLMGELSDVQRVSLASLVQHPGWAVVELMHTTACERATAAVIKIDPVEDEGAERKIPLLQLRARERNEFSLLILKSIAHHIEAEQFEQQQKEEKPEENPILKLPKRNEQ